MPRVKVRECTDDDCDGVMKLANVADGIPLWKCRKCDHRDQQAGTYNPSVYSFERDAPGEAYSPFSDENPDPTLSWDEFREQYADDLTQLD